MGFLNHVVRVLASLFGLFHSDLGSNFSVLDKVEFLVGKLGLEDHFVGGMDRNLALVCGFDSFLGIFDEDLDFSFSLLVLDDKLDSFLVGSNVSFVLGDAFLSNDGFVSNMVLVDNFLLFLKNDSDLLLVSSNLMHFVDMNHFVLNFLHVCLDSSMVNLNGLLGFMNKMSGLNDSFVSCLSGDDVSLS